MCAGIGVLLTKLFPLLSAFSIELRFFLTAHTGSLPYGLPMVDGLKSRREVTQISDQAGGMRNPCRLFGMVLIDS